MLKIAEILKQKGQIIRLFLLFLVSYIRFLFESLKLITVFFKIQSDTWMVKIGEISKQKGTDHKTLLIVSCSIYFFLIWVSETIQIVVFKIWLDMLMLKIGEIFQQKRDRS